MQLSTKDLFAIIAFCAVLAWSASLAGVDSPGYWIGAGASIFLGVFFVRVANDEKSRRYAFLVPVPLLACCVLPVASLSLFANGILLIVAGVFCASRGPWQLRRLWFVALSCTAVSLVLGALPGISEARKLAALRREFPIQSIADRLRYERSNQRAGSRQVDLSPKVETTLRETEEVMVRGNYRQHQFARIHSREYERFVRSSGFGIGRMIRPIPERLRRPPLQNIPFDGGVPGSEVDSPSEWRAIEFAGKSDEIQHLHTVSRFDFLDPDGFGAVIRPKLTVVGFVEHGFHHSPELGLENRERWTIERLELVSLLRFDEPRVYVLDHLPRMDQLSRDGIPTRPLDAFELEALEQVRTEKDLVILDEGEKHRMLGSLRAASQCLECHSGIRGELLGAFSYVLRAGSVDSESPSGR